MHSKIREFIIQSYGYDSTEHSYANDQAEYGVDWAVWKESDSAISFSERFWKEKSAEEREKIRRETIQFLEGERISIENGIESLKKLQPKRVGKEFNVRFSNQRAWSKEEEEVNGPSIFLAGPTPREELGFAVSYRPEAVRVLKEMNFQGTVLVPEFSGWVGKNDYLDQVEWEEAGLANCSMIIFWVNRNLKTLPGLTTNVEFGRWLEKRKENVIYGHPPDAEKVKYLDWLWKRNNKRKIYLEMHDLLKECIVQCK